jgi:hypothetical protein
MQVKIDLSHFSGHAELSGVELDNLTKILTKFFGTDSRYLDGRYVQIRTGQKLAAKMEIDVSAEFMAEAAFKVEKDASNAKAAALAEEQRIERADLAAEIFAGANGDETRQKLDTLLGEKQSLLYWNDRHERNPFVGPYTTENGIYFYGGKDSGMKFTIGLNGAFNREEV